MPVRLIAYAVIAGALGLLGWQWHARGERIDALHVRTGRLSAERDECAAERDALDQALADIRRAGEADRARAEAANRAAAQATADAQRRVQAALAARVPPECPAAVQWLGDTGRALAQEWAGGR